METIQDVLTRLRAEYKEMPGLSLTAEQVQRLCSIEPTACRTALAALVEAKFLQVTSGGRYVRQRDREFPSLRPAKAHLGSHARFMRAS